MSQDDYVISSAPRAEVLTDLNNQFAAIQSLNSGSTAPSSTVADMLWADTSTTPHVIKIRNASDAAFNPLFDSNGTLKLSFLEANIGIGDTSFTPSRPLHIQKTTTGITLVQIENTNASAQKTGYRLTHINNSWQIIMSTAGSLQFNDITNGKTPFQIVSGAPTNVLFINNNGRTMFNGNNPAGQVHIDQSSASGAIPVLILEQDDVDDSFINFIGTSSTSGIRSISSDSGEAGAVSNKVRCEINGVTGWIRIYADHT